MTSKTSVDLSFEQQEVVILGTEYAGEMKKGIFTVMNYIMPRKAFCRCTVLPTKAKMAISRSFSAFPAQARRRYQADQRRALIGDDEHCWTEEGVFNIEGGCYAKAIDLSAENEPEIYGAIKFGTVLENVVVYDEKTHEVDYHSTVTPKYALPTPSSSFRTPKSHALAVIRKHHPAHSRRLRRLAPCKVCSRRNKRCIISSAATAKRSPAPNGRHRATNAFSACFGAAFMVWHPSKYAELLAKKMEEHKAKSMAGQHRLDRRSGLWRRFAYQAQIHASHHRRHPRRLVG